MITRRRFLETTAAAGAAVLTGNTSLATRPTLTPTRGGGRKRVAIIASIWEYLKHAQHIGDRFLVGYPHDGEWHAPDIDVVSLFVHQKKGGDQTEARAREFGFKIYPTIAEALRCGGKELAVDAVLTIVEHGDYPRNAKGQVLYPRFEFFQEIVRVFEEDGRAVPVFNDKHLSYSHRKARKMVEDSRRLGFPMLAGSSLPVTWRLPELELPYGCVIEDALMIGNGISDPMDYHALEAMQCMVERRKGGETGVKSVQMLDGEDVWKAGEEGRWSRELLEAAIARCHNIRGMTDVDCRPQDLVNNGELPRLATNPAAYFIERVDGTPTTLLMLDGAIGDFAFAARVRGTQEIQSTQFYLPPRPNVTYSACLAHKIEEMFMTGEAPYPVERTQIVSATLDRCLDSRIEGHKRLETPELAIGYQAPIESHFCRT